MKDQFYGLILNEEDWGLFDERPDLITNEENWGF